MKITTSIFAVLLLAASAFADETNSIDWSYGRPGVNVVTNAPSWNQTANLVGAVSGEVVRVEAKLDQYIAGGGGGTGGVVGITGDYVARVTGETGIVWTATAQQGTNADLAVQALTESSNRWDAAAAAAATAYSPSNPPPAVPVTNLLLSAMLGTNGWWQLCVITNGVTGEMR